MSENQHSHQKLTAAGLLITLGIIYGDIGTSPLYVMKAIVGNQVINKDLILGGLSCVFWTLTLQTTLKYVVLTLRADNNGEGGIFSLYALVRRRWKYLFIPAMIGGCTLLADGIITPPISVASAIEGLRLINPDIRTVPIVIAIISVLFFVQRFGTKIVGNAFGPVMMVWFSMLAVLGAVQLIGDFGILAALNPYYAYNILATNPEGILLLGAVFLCTTGAEALYSDLGHCGRENIRISWIFVKICLLLNYFGQGAYLLSLEGQQLSQNPFYGIMPEWFLITGIIIATLAAIIASQALITGSFTLISEAIRLDFWPKMKINYPSDSKGQLYVPAINTFLWIGCVVIVLYFQESEHMEAAYGLAITLTMLMTTFLLYSYLELKRFPQAFIYLFLAVYTAIEIIFLYANLQKFIYGGYVTILLGGALFLIMFIWFKAGKYKSSLTEYVEIEKYSYKLRELSNDNTIPKYATNLIYLTSSRSRIKIEEKIIYSIFDLQPKRADIYWFVHVETTDEPYTAEYEVNVIADQDIIYINFRLGFRIEPMINVYFKQVVEEMVKNDEVDITSRYASLNKAKLNGDFRFVIIERFLSNENDLPVFKQLLLESYYTIKKYAESVKQIFGLDENLVTTEKVPLLIKAAPKVGLKRIK